MAVIVTVDNANGGAPSGRIDLEYFRTPPGLVKVVQFILGVVLLCMYTPIWLSVVVHIGSTITFIWIWFYFFGVQTRYQSPIPWPVLEFYYTAGATFAYAITSLLTFFIYFPAAIFGLMNTVAYGAGAFFLMSFWKEWKSQNVGIQGQGQGI